MGSKELKCGAHKMGYLVLVVRPHKQTADTSHRSVKYQKYPTMHFREQIKLTHNCLFLEIV